MNNSYVVINPVHRNAGFFSYVWETLRNVHQYPNKNYYFYFGPESVYYDNTTVGFNNVWDYYFQQPHSNSYPTNIEKHIREINNDIESEYREGLEFNLDYESYNKRRFVFNAIINQYYRVQPYIQEKIDSFYSSNFLNKKVVGIHCRGTDHPNNTDIEKYLDKIEELSTSYDIIFAMSDEQNKIDVLKKRFGNKVVTYDTFRSTTGQPIHIQLTHMHNPRLIGEEVLIETYLLAQTNLLLLYTGSNVNFYARALNPTLQYITLN